MTYEQIMQIKNENKGVGAITLQCNRWIRFTRYLEDAKDVDTKRRYQLNIVKAECQLRRLLGWEQVRTYKEISDECIDVFIEWLDLEDLTEEQEAMLFARMRELKKERLKKWEEESLQAIK